MGFVCAVTRKTVNRVTGKKRQHYSANRGLVLIVVLWIMVILSLMAFTFVQAMRVELSIVRNHSDEILAMELAKSGIARAIAILQNDETGWDDPKDEWFDNEAEFSESALGDGTFTVSRPDPDEEGGILYGPCDEASKLNLNTLDKEMLLALPRMTEEIADAILDWRDPDDQPRTYGAEGEYYETLDTPYACKNSDFETVEELLYVRSVDWTLLYGEDANLNGKLDSAEDDGDENFPPDDRDGELDGGIMPLVTVYSYDLNATNDGQKRVNLNTSSDNELRNALSENLSQSLIEQIVAYRKTHRRFASIADLLNVAGMDSAAFQAIADLVSITSAERIPGLINVNTAPRAVLLALPGMDNDKVDSIVHHRSATEESLDNIGWLLEVLEKEDFANVANLITARSFQFTIRSTGRVANRPVFKTVRVVYDRAASPGTMLSWKDVTRLGNP